MSQPVVREVKKQLQRLIHQAWEKGFQEGLLPSPGAREEIMIDVPKERAHGNFASNIAFQLAGRMRAEGQSSRAPREIAEILRERLPAHPYLAGAETAGAGFLNFRLTSLWLEEVLLNLAGAPGDYGRIDDLKGERIQLEFISANPVGPMNVVNARAGALGDSLARLFAFCGADVEKEYYVNDYGVQVTVLGESLEARYREILGEEVVFPEHGYQGEYLIDMARELLAENGRSLLDLPLAERINFCREWGCQRILASQRKDLEDFGILYDRWFSERTLHESGAVEAVVERMEKNNLLYEKDGALWFWATAFGDEKDRVVRTADGRTTYFTADIAYHLDKLARGFTHLINIWGPDHHGYIARMKAALEALGYGREKLEILIAQQINLIKDGKPYKMSKRRGEFITMRDLLEEVGNDAARWYFLMRSPDSHLDFNLDLAKQETAENPVFYVQYAHARIASLFRQLDGEFKPDPAVISGATWEEDELEILEKVAFFPETIALVAGERAPHRLTAYLLELATLFHSYYNRKRFLTEDQRLTHIRLSLAFAVGTVVRNGLRLLGITAPEKM